MTSLELFKKQEDIRLKFSTSNHRNKAYHDLTIQFTIETLEELKKIFDESDYNWKYDSKVEQKIEQLKKELK